LFKEMGSHRMCPPRRRTGTGYPGPEPRRSMLHQMINGNWDQLSLL
jgi:hypothetical protein